MLVDILLGPLILSAERIHVRPGEGWSDRSSISPVYLTEGSMEGIFQHPWFAGRQQE
jgi:hypothetical protein